MAYAIYEAFHSHFRIISLFKPNLYADDFLYTLSPFEWVGVLGSAKTVITSYFHGAYLSYIQGISAVIIDKSEFNNKYESKLYDLLIRRLNVPELYFSNSDIKSSDKSKEFISTVNNAIVNKYRGRIIQGVLRENETFSMFGNVINSVK